MQMEIRPNFLESYWRVGSICGRRPARGLQFFSPRAFSPGVFRSRPSANMEEDRKSTAGDLLMKVMALAGFRGFLPEGWIHGWGRVYCLLLTALDVSLMGLSAYYIYVQSLAEKEFIRQLIPMVQEAFIVANLALAVLDVRMQWRFPALLRQVSALEKKTPPSPTDPSGDARQVTGRGATLRACAEESLTPPQSELRRFLAAVVVVGFFIFAFAFVAHVEIVFRKGRASIWAFLAQLANIHMYVRFTCIPSMFFVYACRLSTLTLRVGNSTLKNLQPRSREAHERAKRVLNRFDDVKAFAEEVSRRFAAFHLLSSLFTIVFVTLQLFDRSNGSRDDDSFYATLSRILAYVLVFFALTSCAQQVKREADETVSRIREISCRSASDESIIRTWKYAGSGPKSLHLFTAFTALDVSLMGLLVYVFYNASLDNEELVSRLVPIMRMVFGAVTFVLALLDAWMQWRFPQLLRRMAALEKTPAPLTDPGGEARQMMGREATRRACAERSLIPPQSELRRFLVAVVVVGFLLFSYVLAAHVAVACLRGEDSIWFYLKELTYIHLYTRFTCIPSMFFIYACRLSSLSLRVGNSSLEIFEQPSREAHERVKRVLNRFDEVKAFVGEVSRHFAGYHLLSSLFMIFFLTLELFVQFDRFDASGFYISLSRILAYLLVFFAFTSFAQQVKREADETISRIQELGCRPDLDENIARTLHKFVSEYTVHPVEFSAGNMLEVDRSLFTSIVASVGTYLVVLLQFSHP
ncbi:unnamed protein product [Darwinula stevensoni]|uniref:Gustatory receptor n=1 Tax=Darwinula stevensoni TaxID=69355 RepID=A0A7R9A8A3_9CRUS|nr:unnamed protein product [Darwinula stevensoni]CAG0896212.1 unnamed protein product [Darwinula stevensoni]